MHAKEVPGVVGMVADVTDNEVIYEEAFGNAGFEVDPSVKAKKWPFCNHSRTWGKSPAT